MSHIVPARFCKIVKSAAGSVDFAGGPNSGRELNAMA
jgi:hypothetical protein